MYTRNIPKAQSACVMLCQEVKIINIVELCQAVATLPDYTGFPKAYKILQPFLKDTTDHESSLYGKQWLKLATQSRTSSHSEGYSNKWLW